MSPYSMTGAAIVIFALISYSIAILTEQKKRIVTPFVLKFLTAGLILDLTATTFMIIGSSNGPFTLHGLLGYSSLAGMLIDTFLVWSFYLKKPLNTTVTKGLHAYSRYAYAWWIIAFVTGLMLVLVK